MWKNRSSNNTLIPSLITSVGTWTWQSNMHVLVSNCNVLLTLLIIFIQLSSSHGRSVRLEFHFQISWYHQWQYDIVISVFCKPLQASKASQKSWTKTLTGPVSNVRGNNKIPLVWTYHLFNFKVRDVITNNFHFLTPKHLPIFFDNPFFRYRKNYLWKISL
jgi:hypothetical protein